MHPQRPTLTLFMLTTVFVGFLYTACVVMPVAQSGLHRLSSTQIIDAPHQLPVYGYFTPGLPGLVLIGVVFVLGVPLLVLHLGIVLFGYQGMLLEQRVCWFIITLELLVFCLSSYPLADALLSRIFG